MNVHNPPPGVRDIWRRMQAAERRRFGTFCVGAALVTYGVTSLLGSAGFVICLGVAACTVAYLTIGEN